MSTIPTAYTWTVGELVTASKLNSYLRDAVTFLLNRPYALLQRSSNQSIPDSTTTDMAWNLEAADSDNAHSTVTNSNRYTVVTAGVWDSRCSTPWATNITGAREMNFRVNGLTSYTGHRFVAGANVTVINSAARLIPLSVGDYVTVPVWQSSGVALSVDQTYASGPQWDLIWERA